MLLPLNDSDDALLPNGLSVVSFVALQGGWGPQVTKAKLWEGGGSFCDVGFKLLQRVKPAFEKFGKEQTMRFSFLFLFCSVGVLNLLISQKALSRIKRRHIDT